MVMGERRGSQEIPTSWQRLPGGAEPQREKDLCLNFIYTSSITKMIPFSLEHEGSHILIPTKVCFVGEAGVILLRAELLGCTP